MDPCVLVVSTCTTIVPSQIIKGILETEELPTAVQVSDGILSYPWHIDTKYYSTDVRLCSMNEKNLGNKVFAESVNAVIICFDSESNTSLSVVEEWLTFTKEFQAEIKILICDRCSDSDTDSTNQRISKLTVQRWCVKNGFELVELNGSDADEDPDVEDDFPESLGISRVVQALHAHLWPNLTLKDYSNPMLSMNSGLAGLINGLSGFSMENGNDYDNDGEDAGEFIIPQPHEIPPLSPHQHPHSGGKDRGIQIATVHPMPKLYSVVDDDAGAGPVSSRIAEGRGAGGGGGEEGVKPPSSPGPGPGAHGSRSQTTTHTTPVAIVPPIITSPTPATGTGSGTGAATPPSTPLAPIPTQTNGESSHPPAPAQSQNQNGGGGGAVGGGAEPTRDERIDSMLEAMDGMSEDCFEELFLNLSAMKSKASNLSPTQRKAYAEQMTMAFWRTMGGAEDEINMAAAVPPKFKGD